MEKRPPPSFGATTGLPSSPTATMKGTQRGYFGVSGDISVADVTTGPSSDRALIAVGSKNVPFAHAFKSAAGGPVALSKKFHAHSDHSFSSTTTTTSSNAASGSYNPFADVPERALQPKVFVPHARSSGSEAVPRRVAVERKRREFAATAGANTSSSSSLEATSGGSGGGAAGLETLLRQNHVDYSIPGGDASGAAGVDVASTLPLEAFDNSDFESRSSCHEWISLGVDEATGSQRGVPGLALCTNPEDGTGYWRSCRAVSWDTATQVFTVVWTEAANTNNKTRSTTLESARDVETKDNGKEEEESSSNESKEERNNNESSKTSWTSIIPGACGTDTVRRIHICFASEDPATFAHRLSAAFVARREAATLIKYHLSIDCMPIEDGPIIQHTQADRIQALATAARSLQAAMSASASAAGGASKERAANLSSVLQLLLGEAQTDFARTMNRIIFDLTVANARANRSPVSSDETGEGSGSGGSVDLLSAVDLPAPAAPKPLPEVGLIRIPSHDFAGIMESYSFQSLYTREEVISLLQRMGSENVKIYHKGPNAATGGMLVCSAGKPVKLDEFETVNATATTAYANFLREGWATVIRNHVRHCLGNAGKGHFNLRETNAKAYEYSKLRRLLRLIGYRMADDLRSATDGQLIDFAAAISGACDVNVTVTSPSIVTVSSSAGANGIPRRPPLFAVDLVIRDEAPVVTPEQLAALAEANKKLKPGQKPKTFVHTGPLKKVFGLSTPPAALAAAPLNAFDHALGTVSGIKTVERQVMDRLFWPEEPTVPTVHPLEPHVTKLREAIAASLQRAVVPLDAYVATFEPYIAFLNQDVDEMIAGMKAKFASTGFNLADCKTAIQKAKDSAAALLEELPQTMSVGVALVSVIEVRNALIKKHISVSEGILKLVATLAGEMSTDIIKAYDQMIKQLSQPTADIESLTAVKEFMAACPDKVKDQQARAELNAQSYQLLDSYSFALPKDQFELGWKALMGPSKIFKKITEVEDALAREKSKYMDEMAAEQAAFDDSLKDLSAEVGGLGTYKSMADVEAAAIHVTKIKASLDSADEKSRLFNNREALFGKDLTNYDQIGEIKKGFEPFFTLWDTASSWLKQHASWMGDAFVNINSELIEREAGAMGRNMIRSVKSFEKIGHEGCLTVAKEIRDQTESFKPLIPLVVALRNPGMRTRHWAELSDAIGEKVDPDKDGADFTLTKVIDMNLARHIDVISKVGEKAGKEYQLEQALDKMAHEWSDMVLDVIAYRETGTYVIKGVDELQALLDEHNTMSQAMTFSAFKKPFAERIDSWVATLNCVAEVLDEWLKVQRSWLYLEPIFSSSDIQKQLPTEYKRFATVDKNWRATLLAGRGGPGNNPTPQKAIQFCNNAKLLEKWQESNKFLDLVQKGLADYLETKRAGFARFYFLSNDELLEILSQTKDPRAVQPHLKKCFEGVRTVEFLPTTEIKVMVSGEKEKIPLAYNVDPRGKNVEMWMSMFEECMKQSVRSVMHDAIVDYTVTPRTGWVQKWPGQCVLNASQLHWTREIEDGIRNKGNEGVKDCYDQQMRQLKDIVNLIRGRLDPLARITLGSLTVIDVHARDVTKRMWQVGVATINDFEWISQLRYVWLGEGKEGDMWVQMVSSTRPYGYEYLGNSLRLVITPLTDKCYMTIMSALQMNLGGAPAGPAGTGKTETTKDLAKALAMYCLAEDDMQILTDRGFLFLHEFEAAQRINDMPLIASYDHSSREIVIEEATQLIINPSKQQTLIEFTSEDEEASWGPKAGAYGLSSTARVLAGVESALSPSKGLSLRVTPEHDMFVMMGEVCQEDEVKFEGHRGYNENTKVLDDFHKLRADAIFAHGPTSCAKMLARAEGGIRTPALAVEDDALMQQLGLQCASQLLAFMQLFGYWLGNDSSLGSKDDKPAVMFCQTTNQKDVQWLRERLAETGLSSPADYRTYGSMNVSGQVHFAITSKFWVDFFYAEYGNKYSKDATSSSSAKWIPSWAWTRSKDDMRAIITGLRFANDKEQESGESAISTSSVRFRDELVRLGMMAGYSARFQVENGSEEFRGDTAISATAASWVVSYPDSVTQAEPIIRRTEMKQVPYNGRTWCVNVPHGMIIARRAHATADGTITKASTPVLIGNCVVFNCSDGLDYIAMGKFFKGLAAAGAWACFDEFNRIDVEVLSVVAQQVLTLTEGVRAGVKRIFFEGTEIPLNPRFASFITMNPGYAGRSELPDNLKVLFRPVAMMVPDYALIGEIMLYSFGFEKARGCADKMVATFKLCSEQLSSQDHYDYGMRAVKSVITAAGNLKSAYPDDDEELLLYRALSDVNLPKFLAPDLPLFRGIMSDLFPTIKNASVDHGDLNRALALCFEKRGMQAVPYALEKATQMYEMVVVRHGMMMVGPTGGGKSVVTKVTATALTMLAAKGIEGAKIEKTHIFSLNPKSITMGQLYGQFDDATHEWTDGILADLVRECAKANPDPNAAGGRMAGVNENDSKWVLFDGPVDAIWIENMNTVLDDNKKLCLVSGEIIGLSSQMTIMFEVEDLAVASPATVSRCGMVYLEPTSLGYDVLVQSWIEALPPCFSGAMRGTVQALFDTYCKSVMYFLRRYLEEPVPTVDNQLIRGLTNLLDCFFEPYAVKEGRDAPTPEAVKQLTTQLPAIFVFAVIWSLAATSNTDGRRRFNAFLRQETESAGFSFPFPETGLIYDYCWDFVTAKWVPWMSTIPAYEVPRGADFSEIIVQTKDTVRYKYLAKQLLVNRKMVLMSGPTGTGKTVNIVELLSADMPKEYIPVQLTFSAQTSANQTQDIIDAKMEKRQRGTFGPPAGSVFVLFVDDLNMPQKETYGAQPPIELLRQWADYSGWYDRKERVFRKIVDTVLIAAMGPPGGGRNPLTQRMVRQFNVINYTPMDDESMRVIFETILTNFCLPFPDSAKALVPSIVQGTIAVYNTIADQLLPTPSKPHYTFNLRDLGKVFQGMLMADYRKVPGAPDFARMWVHETRRVFMDRLINAEDRGWFNNQLQLNVEGQMKLAWEDVAGSTRPTILFGDYMVPGADPKIYCEVDNMSQLQPVIEEYLNDYNAESKSPMNLVMFLDAIEHVSRISRIIRQPGGNALLLGVGGSGRQSLTRLATFMADYALFTIEISKGYGRVEWRDDLKKVLMKAGIEEKATVFLFNDTQIIFEGMVEDINGILNSGDVPNLYAAEDQDAIMNACRQDCLKKRLPPTKINVFAQYLSRVKKNIHLVLAMSPMGDAFRNRLRMFPALVNCTTIDWFSEWPDEALKSVALTSLRQKDLALGESLDGVVEFFKVAHQSVAEESKRYASQMRRYNYVTPTSYLELLSTFKSVLEKKRDEVGTLKNRLQIGLDKIISTEGVVSKLQDDIKAMQPILQATQVKVAEMIVQIGKDKEAAAITQAAVEKEEAEANKLAADTKAIADDAQADLDKALPALEKAVSSLDKLKKGDIDEVKAMKTPPKAVKTTMQAALIMFNIKPKVINDPDNLGKKLKDYWGTAQGSLLQDAKKLLQDLKEFDKDNIPESVIAEVEPVVQDPEFTFEVVDKASKACSGICLWVHAMHTYYYVAKNVEPKKAKLKAAQETLDATMSKLAAVKARLQEVLDKLAELEQNLANANAEKDRLEKESALAEARLVRANKLLGGLGGEKGRWIETVARLITDYAALVGDSLVAATTIAYLGAFTSDYRASQVKKFQGELVRLNLPHTQGCTMINVLADPVQVRAWNLSGLPTDQHSVENGIVMRWARRWPLLIDPQGQANRFIKNMGKDKTMAPNGIDILRMTEKKFLQGLENGIRFGKWVLIENVGENLDAALEPVLLQQVFKQGGSDMIKLGDSTVPYNADFKLFMTSTLPNPHYAPESQVKVSLLNFTITPKGLEDQLLGVFVITELPELEEKKNALMLSNARNKKELQDIESRILFLLSNSKGNILDDSELIETLAVSKVKAGDITAQVKEAEITEKEIDATRENYRPVAYRASILYFCIADLSGVDPMYQYSLPWFTNLFISGIRNSPPAEDYIQRMENLNNFFTYSIYKNVCRSLFEVHKPLFSLLLTIKILQGDNKIDNDEWKFVISGLTPIANPNPRPNPSPDWITDKIWSEVTSLSVLPAFAGYDESWSDGGEHIAGYRAIFDSNDSHKVPMPGKFAGFSGMQRMCVLRTIRPDKALLAAQDFVIESMGKRFVEPPPFDLASCYEDSSVNIPLIFVLSSGSDPTRAFFSFAETLGMRSKVEGISLGQGQGVIAARLIDEAQTKGSWVLLQNCHLAASWMSELERIVESIDPEKVSRDFRLWLTSMPTKAFPVSILQNGIKMTNEPPKGLKANIRNFFYSQSDETLNQTTKPAAFRKILFGLAFFHAVVQERKRFGPLGWNRPYDFNESDMEISMRQVMLYLDEYEQIPYRVMHVLTSYINYGGRVTDDKDSRTIDVILRDYFTARIQDEDYKFTPSGTYFSPTVDEDAPHKGVMEYIETLPLNAHPEVFGMHANANITCELNETEEALDVLVSLQPRSGGGGGLSREDIIADRARDIQKKMPNFFDIEAIGMAYPVLYEESMNTVLLQECIRYNRLLAVIKRAVSDIQKALKGLIVMSKELDAVGSALATNRVPGSWEAKAYPSLKPLAAWVADLVERLAFLGGWVAHGPPPVFWVSGFFFPQAFLTGTMQNYARKKGLPIDTLGFDYHYQLNTPWEGIKAKPEDGCYIRGLFLEGARFDEDKGLLADSLPKVLFTSLPVIHLHPVQFRQAPKAGIALIPCYKILSRWGVLATTGHSSNFVQFLELPTDRGDISNNEGKADCAYWIKAGVASFTQLKF